MNCLECKATNPDENRYCGQCGAELGRTLDETVRKKGFRDRQATEIEITEAVVERLMKWASWLGGATALVLALFGFALGLFYHDTKVALDIGKTQIERAVAEGKNNVNADATQGKTSIADATKDIGSIKVTADALGKEVNQLRSDIKGYKEVNGEMETLQKQFHGQTADLSRLDLRVHSLETVAEGPASLAFTRIGCQPSALAQGVQVAYCAQGSPPFLYQRTPSGDLRPVASLSPDGFQDASTGPKPTCSLAGRGTFYVEKGIGKEPDKPFLCARKGDNTYEWVRLGAP